MEKILFWDRSFCGFRYEQHHDKNLSSGFPSRCDTNQAVEPQKLTKGLKIWIKEVERLYYLCRENEDADLGLPCS